MSMSATKTQEQTQTRSPYAPAVPGLERAANEAETVFDQRLNQQFFPGQTFANPSAATTNALSAQAQRARQGSPLVGAAQQNLQGTIEGAYLDQGNPYMEGLRNRIMADVMPGINATFSRAGRSGSAGHGYALGRGLGDAFAPIEYQNYEAERGRQMQAASMAPGLADYDYKDIAMLRDVGAAREAQRQQHIDERMARHNFEQNRHANALQEYTGTLGQIGSMGGESSSVSTQSQEPSGLQTALGLGMMAAAPFTGGASLGGLGGMMGGAGAAGGLGALFGGAQSAAPLLAGVAPSLAYNTDPNLPWK